MVEIEYTEDWAGQNETWETLITGKDEKEALQNLIAYVNENEAIAGFFRIKK